ncbi:hypothetical protein JMN32_08310 [Fulvivirga sp. 29W222]|uniref:PKD domain-containing protein n=1 Tax=Fulvivirga marina TaxID=2494733 RepID=A0A937FWH4_9BACT|nr:hypothetical protein [Fulvivirga marina]MBL6446308.1 hypothetical protein [Fulvivirga marina]
MKLSKNNFFNVLGGLLLAATLLVGCGDDDSGPTPSGALNANAGPDQLVSVGDAVVLDGSGSTDIDGDPFTFQWQIISSPAGSTAALSNPTSPAPGFTPDVVGPYTIELTIANEKGNSADEVTISVEEAIAPEEIGGTHNTALTLVNRVSNPRKPDYIASTNVNMGADLIIEPGVKIVFGSNVALNIGSSGAILAEGTASEPIVMTGTTESNGFWKGVGVFSSDVRNVMDFVEVYYGGSTEYGVGLYASFNVGVENGDKLKVTNCTIGQSSEYGLFVENGGELTGFANNTFENNGGIPLAIDANNMTQMDANSSFTGNGTQYVELLGSTLSLGTESVWRAFADGTPYWATGNIRVESGLKVNEGVVVEFGSDLAMPIIGTGYIIAKGTASNRVKFLGKAGVAGSWRGVQIFTNDTKNEFDYVEIAHGGSNVPSAGLYELANLSIENGDRAKVTNTIIRDGNGYGLYVENGGALEAFANNEFKNNSGVAMALDANQVHQLDGATTFTNNGDNSVEVLSSTMEHGATEVTWVALSNQTPYFLSGNVDIESGLVVNAGANFEAGTDVRITVSGDGYLSVEGAAANKVNFSGKTKASGAWRGIGFFTNDVRNLINHAVIRHGGSADLGIGLYARFNVGVENGDQLTVTNSTISDSAGYGIFAETGSTLTASGNTFSNNTSGNTN